MMQKTSLVVFGVSNMLSDIFDCAHVLGLHIGRIVMNQPEAVRERTKNLSQRLDLLESKPLVETLDSFIPGENEEYCIGTSSPKKKALVALLKSRYGMAFRNLVHPTAYVSPYSKLGEGIFVGANTSLSAGAEIGTHVFINRGVTVGHDTAIGEYARINPGCNIGGHVRVGEGATVGMGAVIIEELVVGSNALVGAGAVVTRDVKSSTLVVGVPAKVKKRL